AVRDLAPVRPRRVVQRSAHRLGSERSRERYHTLEPRAMGLIGRSVRRKADEPAHAPLVDERAIDHRVREVSFREAREPTRTLDARVSRREDPPELRVREAPIEHRDRSLRALLERLAFEPEPTQPL